MGLSVEVGAGYSGAIADVSGINKKLYNKVIY